LNKKCPECGYDFSNKEDFLMYAEAGEVIQCPDCGTELKVTEDKQLKRVVLEDQDWGESAHEVKPELKIMNPKLEKQPKPKEKENPPADKPKE
jgi:lysine biosynthesis protein LysW